MIVSYALPIVIGVIILGSFILGMATIDKDRLNGQLLVAFAVSAVILCAFVLSMSSSGEVIDVDDETIIVRTTGINIVLDDGGVEDIKVGDKATFNGSGNKVLSISRRKAEVD